MGLEDAEMALDISIAELKAAEISHPAAGVHGGSQGVCRGLGAPLDETGGTTTSHR